MSDTIHATTSGYIDNTESGNGNYHGSQRPRVNREGIVGRYTFPSLTNYADAQSIKLHLFVEEAPAPQSSLVGHLLTITANKTSASGNSNTKVSATLTSAVTSTTELVVDWSSKISELTSLGGSNTYVFIESNVYGTTYLTSYNATKKAYLEIEMSNKRIVYYCVNGVHKQCEQYYCVNGVWKQCESYYATGGVWKEIGE